MPIEEQKLFLNKRYAEAIRYMDNANATLKTAGKENNNKYYKDDKYVKTACGTAYNGVLVALDAWLKIKGVEIQKGKRKSIEFYTDNVAALDGKMSKALRTTYNILHLAGYYDGETRIKIINEGFDTAYEIIDKIKPNA